MCSTNNRSYGKNWKYGDNNNSYRNPNRSKWKCHYCGKQGHKANECYKRINDSEKNKSKKSFDSKRNAFCVALKQIVRLRMNR